MTEPSTLLEDVVDEPTLEDVAVQVYASPWARGPHAYRYPHLFRKFKPEALESFQLDQAGFRLAKTDEDYKYGCVSAPCRQLALYIAHTLGLSLALGHLSPGGSGKSARPRITRDGLLHILKVGRPPGYENQLDGIVYDSDRYPEFNQEAHKGRGEWTYVVDLWLKGHSQPFRCAGHYPAQRMQKRFENGKFVGKDWVDHPYGRDMAYKDAIYGAAILATGVGIWAPGLVVRRNAVQAQHVDDLAEDENGRPDESVAQQDAPPEGDVAEGEKVDTDTGEITTEKKLPF